MTRLRNFYLALLEVEISTHFLSDIRRYFAFQLMLVTYCCQIGKEKDIWPVTLS